MDKYKELVKDIKGRIEWLEELMTAGHEVISISTVISALNNSIRGAVVYTVYRYNRDTGEKVEENQFDNEKDAQEYCDDPGNIYIDDSCRVWDLGYEEE